MTPESLIVSNMTPLEIDSPDLAAPLPRASEQTNMFKYRCRCTPERRLRRAFTLLEVILAIAITGFVLAAATSFVVSISRIWVDREDRHFFEDHVDGVTEFLRASFATAGTEIALNTEDGASPSVSSGSTSDQNGGLMRASDETVGWGNPPGFAEYQDPVLNFKLTTTPPLLVNLGDAPAIGIDAFLYFGDGEGLSLLWYSLLQEEAEDTDDLRRTEISPLVTAVTYIYWDDRFEKWEEESEPQEGEGNDEFLLPRFVKLTFEYQGETKERTLTIPIPSTSVLLF